MYENNPKNVTKEKNWKIICKSLLLNVLNSNYDNSKLFASTFIEKNFRPINLTKSLTASSTYTKYSACWPYQKSLTYRCHRRGIPRSSSTEAGSSWRSSWEHLALPPGRQSCCHSSRRTQTPYCSAWKVWIRCGADSLDGSEKKIKVNKFYSYLFPCESNYWWL